MMFDFKVILAFLLITTEQTSLLCLLILYSFKYTNIFLLLHNFIPLISNFRQNYSKQHTSSILFRFE